MGKRFLKINSNIDITPLLLEILRQPNLWNRNDVRLSKLGPHHETFDMFLRYKDETENIEKKDWSNFGDEHDGKWYKTYDLLPSARKLIFHLMYQVNGERLGGIFIYKVPPGKKIHPHTDRGWHVDYYDKFNICLQTNEDTVFAYADEVMIAKEGDIHWFTNDSDHWVVNDGNTDHIIMTVCIRLDRGERIKWSS